MDAISAAPANTSCAVNPTCHNADPISQSEPTAEEPPQAEAYEAIQPSPSAKRATQDDGKALCCTLVPEDGVLTGKASQESARRSPAPVA
eukprot:11174800-Lingulodinium_polyedra.AAC.1